PRFNLEYLDDLREFLQNEEMDIQDFLRFHRPDALQVVTPKGEVLSLEEGATALDFAFAVHEKLGLRALSARVNGVDAELSAPLRPGDRVEIVADDHPVADDRYLGWAHSRKALARLRRYMNRREAERAALTGREWLLEAAEEYGVPAEAAEAKVRERAAEKGVAEQELYRRICLGTEDIAVILGARPAAPGLRLPGSAILQRLRGREGHRRKVMRYEFNDPHIRFCPACAPVEGDEIEGVPEAGRLLVHRFGCTAASALGRVPLGWEKRKKGDLWDPGPMEVELNIKDEPGILYTLLLPFKDLGIDIRDLSLPSAERGLRILIQPGSDRALNSLIRGLRKLSSVEGIRVFRAREEAGLP
ncbi:MAG: bifunctional (p)ppGpp synthetase/guanosine-3',5'-bis(diphosphate) 3'-pyrophosphohydrolase, partial [Deltaproteobacteria bacterium]|nr:bifunctional (p)ppGpp synthetase/guanosine-3',5'-bis(diphosphate) 3'-pyrophosphohydrolase [Deltaproteobacteria bacterium]